MEREGGYYETEYTLTVPYLCSFRASADGTATEDDGGRGNWKNLKRGSTFVVDGATYVAVGIERFLDRPETKIRLHNASRFAVDVTAGAPAEILPDPPEYPNANAIGEASYVWQAGSGDIAIGDGVALISSNEVERANARNEHFEIVYGIAITAASDGEAVKIQTAGVVSCADWSLTPGQPVYLRSSALGSPNVSSTPLASSTATEDLYVVLGVAVTATSFKFEPSAQFIFHPPVV
jgi:hypothetical protein